MKYAVFIASLAVLFCFNDVPVQGIGFGKCPEIKAVSPFNYSSISGKWYMQYAGGLDWFQGKARCVEIMYVLDCCGDLLVFHEIINKKNETEVFHGTSVKLGHNRGNYTVQFEEKKLWGKKVDFHLKVVCENDGIMAVAYCESVALVKKEALFCLTRERNPCPSRKAEAYETCAIWRERLEWDSLKLDEINQTNCC